MQAGRPSLKPWEEVGLEEIGTEEELAQLAAIDAAAAAAAGLKLIDDGPPPGSTGP